MRPCAYVNKTWNTKGKMLYFAFGEFSLIKSSGVLLAQSSTFLGSLFRITLHLLKFVTSLLKLFSESMWEIFLSSKEAKLYNFLSREGKKTVCAYHFEIGESNL